MIDFSKQTEDEIVCPHCEEMLHEGYVLEERFEGEKLECPSCKKNFVIRLLTRNFVTQTEVESILEELNDVTVEHSQEKKVELALKIADALLEERKKV